MWNIFKKFFKKDANKDIELPVTGDEAAYYFHEDLYLQIELLPKENFEKVTRTAEEIAMQAAISADDYGWTSCYIRKELDFPTRAKDIPVVEMVSFLINNDFTEFSSVTTGYASTVIECKNIKAFQNRSIVISVDYEGSYLAHIWMSAPPLVLDNGPYKKFLLKFAAAYPFLLSDWNNSSIVDISNEQEIDRYFSIDE